MLKDMDIFGRGWVKSKGIYNGATSMAFATAKKSSDATTIADLCIKS
jgi:hypothetical protein